MTLSLLALFAGKAKTLTAQGSGAWWDKPWTSGIFKAPLEGPVWLAYGGLPGDEQADRVHHGGPDKALCVYPAAHYEYWRARPGLAELPFGAFGENITLGGAVETDLCIGDCLALGEAVVEISQPRQPCWKLAHRWHVQDFQAQVEQTGFTGFYFRVLRHGHLKVGDRAKLLERPWPQWTLAECNALMHHRRTDRQAALALSQCPPLSGSWKDRLFARATH